MHHQQKTKNKKQIHSAKIICTIHLKTCLQKSPAGKGQTQGRVHQTGKRYLNSACRATQTLSLFTTQCNDKQMGNVWLQIRPANDFLRGHVSAAQPHSECWNVGLSCIWLCSSLIYGDGGLKKKRESSAARLLVLLVLARQHHGVPRLYRMRWLNGGKTGAASNLACCFGSSRIRWTCLRLFFFLLTTLRTPWQKPEPVGGKTPGSLGKGHR